MTEEISGKDLNSLQFELWQECNSLCDYCYLGKENRKTPEHLKLKSIKDAYEKISDLSIYSGEHPVQALSYLGGEFFQGQLNTSEIHDEFMKLMDKTAWLLKEGYIKQVWIYATMTIGDQKEMYETLDKFDMSSNGFWLLTSYDTIGRFHTPKMLETWQYHMKNVYEKYPNIRLNTTTIITQDLVERYNAGEFTFHDFMEKYHTALFFKQAGRGSLTKEEMNARLNNRFFPKRSDTIKFFAKFMTQEGPALYDKLFNIQYRADNLYRNFNDEEHHMKLFHRDKNSKSEETLPDGSLELLPCGHVIHYQAYADSDECILCDRQRMGQLSMRKA